jgi:hypothetical protein
MTTREYSKPILSRGQVRKLKRHIRQVSLTNPSPKYELMSLLDNYDRDPEETYLLLLALLTSYFHVYRNVWLFECAIDKGQLLKALDGWGVIQRTQKQIGGTTP